MSSKLYRDNAANIVLFLCHLNRDPVVLNEVLASARSLFKGLPETDLCEDVKFTGNLVAFLKSPVLEQGDAEGRRQKMLEAQDDAEARSEDPSDEMYAYKHGGGK